MPRPETIKETGEGTAHANGHGHSNGNGDPGHAEPMKAAE
jgi:hypothetical protein